MTSLPEAFATRPAELALSEVERRHWPLRARNACLTLYVILMFVGGGATTFLMVSQPADPRRLESNQIYESFIHANETTLLSGLRQQLKWTEQAMLNADRFQQLQHWNENGNPQLAIMYCKAALVKMRENERLSLSQYLGNVSLHETWEEDLDQLLGAEKILIQLKALTTTVTTTATTGRSTTSTSATATITSTSTTVTTITTTTTQSAGAFVTIVHQSSGEGQLWTVFALARALQRVSSYPLVLLTDVKKLPDGTDLVTALGKLNVHILPLFDVGLVREWNVVFWKCQIWSLTQYEKLVWLEPDSVLFRSVDWLFTRKGMWAQRDNSLCQWRQNVISSGVMLLYPDKDVWRGLVKRANELRKLPQVPDMSDGGFQMIIQYFTTVRKQSIDLLSDIDAGSSRCLGKFPTPFLNPDGHPVQGVWGIPAILTRSGGRHAGHTQEAHDRYENSCFGINITQQLYTNNGHQRLASTSRRVQNICQYHPLGMYWRTLFCGAAEDAGLKLNTVREFCDMKWLAQGFYI